MTPSLRDAQRICCLGEVMIELSHPAPGQVALGVAGDTYNTAVYLRRALRSKGKSVAYVTALGQDGYSARITAALQAHQLDTGYIEYRSDRVPGLYAIDTDANGERSFTYWRSESAARSLFVEPCQLRLSRLADFDLIYLSGISMAVLHPEVRQRLIRFLMAFRDSGGLLAYDSNYRPRLWPDRQTAQGINRQMWQICDIALPSLDDEMALFGDADEAAVLERLQGFGVNSGALKRGAAGPLDLTRQAEVPDLAPVARVVDSTAAGDSFNAGYLAALIQGGDRFEAMRAGHDLAARVIAQPGAIIAA